MKADARFSDTFFKIDPSEGHAFKKMFVRARPELVSLKLEEDVDPKEITGAYLSPTEFKEAILDEDTVVIDARNDYEYDLGHFRGAVRPDIRSFRELPEWMQAIKRRIYGKTCGYLLYRRDSLRKIFWLALSEKASRTLVNFTAALQHMVKILKSKESCGMEKCMSLMNGSQ